MKMMSDDLSKTFDVLKEKHEKKVTSLESYSKYYTFKYFNIIESLNVNTNLLLEKIRFVLHEMEIDTSKLYYDAVHQLPCSGRGPRPVTINFVSKLDCDMVWANKSLSKQSSSQVFIREHFNEKVERNIRKLLPIRHAAIDQGQNMCLVKDKLTIDSKPYTVDNLHELPPDLSPDKLATKTINKHTFFFWAATPLNNFLPSKFQKR